MISTHGYVSSPPELGQPDTGGQVVFVLQLSKALAKRGFQVDILTRQFEDQAAMTSVADGVRILRVPYGGPSFRSKETLANFVPELIGAAFQDPAFRQSDYFLINSHYWDAGVAAVRLAKIWKVPHVHTPHSMGLLKRQNRAWGASGESANDHIDERIHHERVIYHNANLVISTAGEQTRCLKESDEYNVPEEKVAQIPPGFDDSLFYRPLEGEQKFIKPLLGWSDPTIFAAGRLAASKGYDLLIQSFPAVLDRIPDAQLIFAIGGVHPVSEESELLISLKILAQSLGVESRVRFIPCVDQARLADYYRAADVFVLCSRNEPFGMTALEAMACGTPTVVTTRGGLWEELNWGQDCIYCDPVDSDALAQAICCPLLQPRIRSQLSQYGASTALSRYTWNVVANRFINACHHRRWISKPSSAELINNRR